MKLPKLGDTMYKVPNTCDRRDPVRKSAKCVVTYKKEPVMQGILRKTNAFVVINENEITHFGTDRNTIRRQLSAKDKMIEFAMEA